MLLRIYYMTAVRLRNECAMALLENPNTWIASPAKIFLKIPRYPGGFKKLALKDNGGQRYCGLLFFSVSISFIITLSCCSMEVSI